jgi:hypothetical protein
MGKLSKTINAPAPTKQQVKVSSDGKVFFDEYLALVRKTLAKSIEHECGLNWAQIRSSEELHIMDIAEKERESCRVVKLSGNFKVRISDE